MAGKVKPAFPDSVSRIAGTHGDRTQFSQDDKLFGGWPIEKTRDGRIGIGGADFVVASVWNPALDTIKAIAKNICFGLALRMHGKQWFREMAASVRIACVVRVNSMFQRRYL